MSAMISMVLLMKRGECFGLKFTEKSAPGRITFANDGGGAEKQKKDFVFYDDFDVLTIFEFFCNVFDEFCDFLVF